MEIFQILRGHQCAAIVINPMWLLTAAHCVKNQKEEVYVYVARTKDITQIVRGPKIAIQQVHYHPDHKETHLDTYNDLALLKLSTSLRFDTGLEPACLAIPYDRETDSATSHTRLPQNPHSLANKMLKFYGWGSLEKSVKKADEKEWKHQWSSRLLQELELVDGTDTDPVCRYRIDANCFYGVKANSSPCVGDSGGPVHLLSKGNHLECHPKSWFENMTSI